MVTGRSAQHTWEGNDAELQQVFADVGFVSAAPCMLPVLRRAWRAARVSDAPLLVEGETGTGKQVLADAIHRLDPKRSSHHFVTLHCGALQESLAETELFGHARGAFSGSVGLRKGLFQSANLGTIFLDDVNDLPQPLQPKLLDILQRGKVRAVGSDEECTLDFRVIAASNQALPGLVREGRFRADLYYRLDVIRLSLPPLRERPSDLIALIMTFVRRHEALYVIDSIDSELRHHLEQQPFPGNIRELEHSVQRMLFAKSTGSTLTLDDWSGQSYEVERDCISLAPIAARLWKVIGSRPACPGSAFYDIERCLLEAAVEEGGTRKRIASQLGISERSLYHKLHAHRIAAGREH